MCVLVAWRRSCSLDKRHPQGKIIAIGREKLWKPAIEAKDSIALEDTMNSRWLITELAKTKGFFSIWMSVFKDDTDMRKRFVEEFTGNAKCCFDSSYKPKNSLGGRVRTIKL